MTRYYFDVTKTLEFGLHTGIQRVVRRLASHLPRLAERQGIEIVPVIATGGEFYPLSADGYRELTDPRPAARTSSVERRPSRWRVLAGRALETVPPLREVVAEYATERRVRMTRGHLFEKRPIEPRRGDVLLLPDALFGGSPAIKASQRWRRNYAIPIFMVVYDLIPVSHPDLLPWPIRYTFRRSMARILPVVDGILAISEATAQEVRERLGEGRVIVRSFHLGHDFASREPATAGLPAALREVSSPMFLMLGTIEPRKGHREVLDAFDRLWAEGEDLTLVICGHEGWDMSSFMERCEKHAEIGRHLHVLQNEPDASVSAIMKHSDALIAASRVEGFGLPIIEALSSGLPVLAADIPVFREVAGDHAMFFDREDPQDLAQLLKDFSIHRERLLERAGCFVGPDWDGAANSFLAETQEILRLVHGAGS